MKRIEDEENQRSADISVGALSKLILKMLSDPRLDDLEIETSLFENQEFRKLYAMILDIRILAGTLGRGDLSESVVSKGYTVSSLKSLQNNMKHLKWLLDKIAEGDFSQRTAGFGELSDVYNQMTMDLRDTRMRLNELAQMDSLTKLPNRRSLERFLSDAFSRAKEEYRDLCVLMIDIDFFKEVNDSFGHQVGDEVLIQVAEILHHYFRSTDMLARYGGEEFVAVLPDCNATDGLRIGEGVRAGIERAVFMPVKNPYQLTVSIGVACLKSSDRSPSDVVARCDRAMYLAKNSGRNQVCFEG